MKLRLPLSLRQCLLSSVFVAVTLGAGIAPAAVMNSDASFVTYTDFGQNMGRYKTDGTANALLQHIRRRDGGVLITYTGGQADYTLEHYMPDFTGVTDNGAFMSLGYNATVSVQHNGVTSGGFTSTYIGGANSVFYQGIEYRIDNSETFLHSPNGGYDNQGNGGFDHKVTRMSKVITDVNTATLYSGTSAEMRAYVKGQLIYHAGAGTMQLYDTASNTTQGLTGAYNYIIGGIDTVEGVGSGGAHGEGDTLNTVFTKKGSSFNVDAEPLPYLGQQGDSGSPVFVFNEKTGQYEYVAAVAYLSGNTTMHWGGVSYVRDELAQYDKAVTSSAGVTEFHIGAVNRKGETISAEHAKYNYWDGREGISTTLYWGDVTDATGKVLQSFVGTQSGINTWADLSPVIDTNNWYHYDNTYLNANPYATDGKELSYADLYVTDNLVFKGGVDATDVVLDATVDLGIGYAQFSLAEGQETARFNVSSAGDGSYQFNHAGYVVDAGVEVHLTLTGSADLVYEWRKVGEGDLYIEGKNNNKILLNLGGSGATYLNRENGYAAYNVLANTGTTVVIADINQIARDFTFGHQGGVLDMNGNSMVWNNDTTDVAASGFTIHALDESAMVANLKADTTTTLTWTQGGQQTFLGSFADNGKDSRMQFVYDGGSGSKLTLNSIYTSLTTKGSGMVVNSGTLTLVGTHTVHGAGSANGKNANRYFNDKDWHYADAASDVTVKNGAIFELGSHARLTGDVVVERGGTFLLRESVQHAQEYIEGGQRLESTAAIADFHGHKGNVSLADNAWLRIEYNEGVTADASYAASITGSGNMYVDLKDASLSLTLTGDSSFSGTKEVISGGVIGGTETALGDTNSNTWLIHLNAWIASHTDSAEKLLSRINSQSLGTLALSTDTPEQLELSGHANLYVGAEKGKTVHYGAQGTSLTLAAVNGLWKLGGGGGELVVHFRLSGDNNLLLGSGEYSFGAVHLGNLMNDFTGDILFNSSGIKLTYTAGALGNANLSLLYGNGVQLQEAADVHRVTAGADGILLVDCLPQTDIDLSTRPAVALGASENVTYSGSITLADGEAYRFSAMDGATLTLNSALEAGRDMVVDAQGLSGGIVNLAGVGNFDGSITVMGHKDGLGGDIVLGVTGNNTLANVSSLVLQKGGVLDIGSGYQTVRNLSTQERALLLGDAESTLVFNMQDEQLLHGAMNLDNAEKTGAANMVLASSDNVWNLFTVQQGTLFTRVDYALSQSGITRVAGGAVLNMNTWNAEGHKNRTMHGNIVLADGAELITGSYDEANVKLTGTLNVEAGATATVSGGKWTLTAADSNTLGGTLSFAAKSLDLNEHSAQYIGGTVDVVANTRFYSGGGAEDMLKHFNHINISAGMTLSVDENHWNTIWQWDKLTGSGKLEWNSDTNHSTTARLILSGDGAFSGDIEYNRKYGNGNRRYQSYLEINGENAASGATLKMYGQGGNSIGSFAVNADNVNLGGLNGNANTHVYAGAAVADSATNAAPGATRRATLTLTGAGEYAFSGTVGSANDTAEQALSLVMNGTGKQTFNGSSVFVNDLLALQGSLVVSANELTVLGSVGVAQGASLKLHDSYTLNADDVFKVVYTQGVSSSAVFESALVLNGGVMSFDYRALGESPALSLAGVSLGGSTAGVQIQFTELSNLTLGKSYTLATGDWSSVSGNITTDDLDYFSVFFTPTEQGLQVLFGIKDGCIRWDGTAEEHRWTAEQVGTQRVGVEGYHTVVFDDAATDNTVLVSEDMEVGRVVFNATEDYSVVSSGGVATAESLEYQGSGVLTLSGLAVRGDATMNGGTLVLEDTGLVHQISGEGGSLVIDWTQEKEQTMRMSGVSDMQVLSGTLTAQTADLSGISTMSVAQLGVLNVSMDSAGSLSASLFAANGTINQTGTGTLTWSPTRGEFTLGTLNLNGGEFVLSTASGVASIHQVQGGGKLHKMGAGELALGAAQLSNLTLTDGGSTTISGTVNVASHLSIGAQSVYLLDGANVTAGQYTSGNTQDGQPSTVVIEEGARLCITGNSDVDDTHASFLLAHWKESSSALSLNGGTLEAKNTSMLMGWNSSATFIANSGDATLKGIRFSSQRGHADYFYLGTAKSGSAVINIGGAGITGMAANDIVQLGKGTFVATADFAVAGKNSLSFVGEGSGTLWDTAGHTISVSTALAGAGNITKLGEGTLSFSGSGANYTGHITVQDGSLQLVGDALNILTSASGVTLNGEAELDLSGYAFSSTGGITLGAELTVGASAGLNLGSLKAEGSYAIFDLSQESALLQNWEHLAGNIYVNGTMLNRYSGASLEVKEHAAMLNFTDSEICSITWNGGATGEWNATAEDWRLTTGAGMGESTSFFKGDVVIFASDAAVTVVGGMTAQSLTLKDGVALSLDGALKVTHAVNFGANSELVVHDTVSASTLAGYVNVRILEQGVLHLSEAQTGNISINGVSGTGTLGVTLDANYGNKLTVDSAFKGTTHVLSGCMTLNGAQVGSALRLADGVNMQFDGGKTASFAGNLMIDGTSQIHANSNSNFTINGSVSGSVYDAQGSGKVTFGADVALKQYINSTGVNSNFNGKTTIDLLTIKNGSVSLSGEAAVKQVVMTGGTLSTDATADNVPVMEHVNLTGGTIAISSNASIGHIVGSGSLETMRGELSITGTEQENKIKILDGSKGGKAAGALRLKEDVSLRVDGNGNNFGIWGKTGSWVLLEEGASLISSRAGVVFTNIAGGEATLRANHNGNGIVYSVGNTYFELLNGHLKYDSSNDATLLTKLTNSSVENNKEGMLTVSNEHNTLSGVMATKGDINVLQLETMSLQELYIATSLTVGAYTGTEVEPLNEATMRIVGKAEFGAGATLNANLHMQSDSVLSIAEGVVQMGSTLTLDAGITLDEATLERFHSLQYGERLELFTGVDGLTLDNEVYSSITVEDKVYANTIFRGLNNNYVVTYTPDDEHNHTFAITVIPEPATTTLGLLALSALAVRRRRR